MLILSIEEFKNKFGIDNKAMSNIRIEDIGKDLGLTSTEIVMRDKKPDCIKNPNFNFIVNQYLTDSTHWVIVIRR